MELTNRPEPGPSVVWLSFNVGFCEVLQHTPLSVTAAPLGSVTFPPQSALVEPTLSTSLVVTIGTRPFTVTVTLATPEQPYRLVPVTV